MSKEHESLFDARRQDGAPQLVTPERVKKYDLDTCPNGPDEYGNWPCDPKVLFGGGYAECQVCGRVAAWGRDTTKAWARG